MSYEEWRKSRGPSWLKGPNGLAWQGAHGRLSDSLVALWKEAVKSSFPMEAPADALDYLGSEIGIPRSQVDANASYAIKLRRAWEVWPFAGTPLGMLLAFEAAGYPAGMVHFIQQEAHAFTLNTDTTLAPSARLVKISLNGGFWTFDANRAFWSRFGILFGDPANLPAGWAAGAVSPPTGASTPTLNEVNGMIRMVNKWRRSAASFQWIRVVTSGNIWGWPPSLNWGAAGLVWGGTVVSWGPAEY